MIPFQTSTARWEISALTERHTTLVTAWYERWGLERKYFPLNGRWGGLDGANQQPNGTYTISLRISVLPYSGSPGMPPTLARRRARAAREAYAARFNYDLVEMYKDLKAKEQARNRNIAPLQPVEPRPASPLPAKLLT